MVLCIHSHSWISIEYWQNHHRNPYCLILFNCNNNHPKKTITFTANVTKNVAGKARFCYFKCLTVHSVDDNCVFVFLPYWCCCSWNSQFFFRSKFECGIRYFRQNWNIFSNEKNWLCIQAPWLEFLLGQIFKIYTYTNILTDHCYCQTETFSGLALHHLKQEVINH